MDDPRELSEAEWRERLGEDAFRVLRQKGTEPPHTGRYAREHAEGTYHCAGCGAPLFASGAKFDSGTGWPSFTRPVEPERVGERPDLDHGMIRTEAYCLGCGGHLGHVFPDGPAPTGRRYCVNSVALELRPAAGEPGSG